jgi:hypothetical protein
MNQQFFNRVARLTISEQSGSVLTPIVVIVTPLRLTFDISKSWISLANIGTVTINNLQTSKRQLIRQDKSLVAILEAGYSELGGPQLMFHGNIVDVSHNIEKPEIITTITIMDGHTALKESKINVSYAKGATLAQIIKEAASSFALPLDATFSYVQLPPEAINSTLAFTGSAASWMDKLCSDNGLQWSIQNGAVKICTIDKADNTPPLQSVLIGSPKRLFKNLISQSLNDFDGYEFNALLMPKCIPMGTVTIQSNEIPKPLTLKVAEVHHIGDSHGADWKTTVKAKDMPK